MPVAFDPSDPAQCSAVFDATGHYRYWLTRTWNPQGPAVNFIMLNPSTADQFRLDATVTRCLHFAIRWGFGTLVVTNLFAWRSTDPSALHRVPDPVGPENNRFLLQGAEKSSLQVAAWGLHGSLQQRDQAVMQLLRSYPLTVLGVTKHGYPRHPLYLRSEATPQPCVKPAEY